MSTVPISIFPNTPLKLNELEAIVPPQGVHSKNLMLLCNQQEVSSINELKQALPRSIWPQLRSYTESVNSYMPNFFDNVQSGIAKYAPPVYLSTNWAGAPQHNVFRIAIIFSDISLQQRITEEVLREQEDHWINVLRLRAEHYANIVESILLFRLLTERSVYLTAAPQSYISAFAALTTGVLQAEAGTENVYFMIAVPRFAVAMRQAPMRLGSAGYIIFNQETPRFVTIPVAVRFNFAPFANYIVGYGDYLVKTTTRYYMNQFRVDRHNQAPIFDRNWYKVLYERYVSYQFPVFTTVTTSRTWAFRIDASTADNLTLSTVDEAGSLRNAEYSAIISSANAPY